MRSSPFTDVTVSRRAVLGTIGVAAAAAAVGVSWPRLAGTDISSHRGGYLNVAILGSQQDANNRADLIKAFNRAHPDIPVQVIAVQGQDWGDFFSKILTMVAAGMAPDVVFVATEGAQLFAERLAEPLDAYLKRDAAEMQNYFDDVHPSLVESLMYEGSLYELPSDFNCVNMFFNTAVLRQSGHDLPPVNWTVDDFTQILRDMAKAEPSGFLPFSWTNRIFGGLAPWTYVNDTSFLKETKAPGGDWFWNRFYPGEAGKRSGGYRWLEANAEDPAVIECVEYLRELVVQGLGTRPQDGGGAAPEGLFAANRIGASPAGEYWVDGLYEAGMSKGQFDVQFFPRWRTQRHQFGTGGYAIMKSSTRKDEAWEWVKFCTSLPAMRLAYPKPNCSPARRSMTTANVFAKTGPTHWSVFYDTLDRFPTTGPMPAPPAQAAVETALDKNLTAAVGAGSKKAMLNAMSNMQRDLTAALGSTQ